MTSSYKPVSEEIWTLTSDVEADVRTGILEEVDPLSLVERFTNRALEALKYQSKERCIARYEEQSDDKTHRRDCVVIAIGDRKLFNQLFNGRCGYRAMNYHSPNLGFSYNSLLVDAVLRKLKLQSNTSLNGDTRKIWPLFELTRAKGQLSIERWREEKGKYIFCPKCPAVVVKGGFLDADSTEKDFKEGRRSQELHNTGFAYAKAESLLEWAKALLRLLRYAEPGHADVAEHHR
jgi:hypothetical protein